MLLKPYRVLISHRHCSGKPAAASAFLSTASVLCGSLESLTFTSFSLKPHQSCSHIQSLPRGTARSMSASSAGAGTDGVKWGEEGRVTQHSIDVTYGEEGGEG